MLTVYFLIDIYYPSLLIILIVRGASMKFLLPKFALSINAYKVATLNDWSIEHVAKTNISFPGIAQAEADYCAGWKIHNPKDE